jgi:hypothetical protein
MDRAILGLSCLLLVWSAPGEVQAQRLEAIMAYSTVTEFSTGPQALEFDREDSVLYMGHWPCVINDQFAPGLARWDGLVWEAVPNTMDSLQCTTHWIRSIVLHAGSLYVSGNIDSIGGLGSAGARLARYDQDGWHPCGVPSSWVRLKNVNDTLWAVGWYDSIGGQSVGSVARYVDDQWQPFGTSMAGDEVRAVAVHEGFYFIGGNFTQSALFQIQDILYWDGAAWQQKGEGFGHQNSWVNTMASYQGALFVGGALFTSDGIPGQHLVVWDGEQWNGFFTDRLLCRNQVNDLQVIDGKLYMAGVFQFAGDAHYYNLLQYDGVNLCAVGKDLSAHAGKFALSVRGNSHEVYFTTTNLEFAGDTVNFLAKWVLSNGADTCLYAPLGFPELDQVSGRIFLKGNPQRGAIEFSLASSEPLSKGSYATVLSMDGRLMADQSLSNDGGSDHFIDMTAHGSGLYMLCVSSPGRPTLAARVVLE